MRQPFRTTGMAPPLALLLLLCVLGSGAQASSGLPGLPFVINTWGGPFTVATDAAYEVLLLHQSATAATKTTAGRAQDAEAALDAVEAGCSACERNQCDGTVGYGGSPDEACETTLDALLMDGSTLRVGAVAALRRVPAAASVARAVMRRTRHSMLAGDQATEFAAQNGFALADLTTPESAARCRAWREARCQPNYRARVAPDPASECGPYAPLPPPPTAWEAGLAPAREDQYEAQRPLGRSGDDDDAAGGGDDASAPRGSRYQASHDTISMIAISATGAMAAGTSTNGAAHKIPGRVGDGPIPGSGSYVDSDVGGCGATGDGDIMMRFLPCYQAVESMRRGLSPRDAAEDAVRRMVRKYPDVSSGIVVVSNKGEHAGAGSGWTFTYSYRGGAMNRTAVVEVPPIVMDESEL